jgi:hypothetical protein
MYRLHHQSDKNHWDKNNVSTNYHPKHAAKKYYVRKESFSDSSHSNGSGDTFLRNVGPQKKTQRNIPEDDILHSQRSGNLKAFLCNN